MTKKWIFYTSISLIIAFISSGFKPLQHEKQSWFFIKKSEALLHLFPSLEPTDYVCFKTPISGKSFTGFKEAIAFRESQGQFKLINSLGYMGKYQFGVSALRAIGINNTATFLNNPKLQEEAFNFSESDMPRVSPIPFAREMDKYNCICNEFCKNQISNSGSPIIIFNPINLSIKEH
jgi:hypothetical protein